MAMPFSAGINFSRCSCMGEWRLIATWQSLSLRNLCSLSFSPTELTVMRFGLQAQP